MSCRPGGGPTGGQRSLHRNLLPHVMASESTIIGVPLALMGLFLMLPPVGQKFLIYLTIAGIVLGLIVFVAVA